MKISKKVLIAPLVPALFVAYVKIAHPGTPLAALWPGAVTLFFIGATVALTANWIVFEPNANAREFLADEPLVARKGRAGRDTSMSVARHDGAYGLGAAESAAVDDLFK